MKRFIQSLVLVTLLFGMAMPSWSQASTEGSDFWVTFLQADQSPSDNAPLNYNGKKYNYLVLSLSISSQTSCVVTIENPFTGFKQTENVSANTLKEITLYKDLPVSTPARNNMTGSGKVCYAVNSEKVDTCALHVTAKDASGNPVKISLFASNYKKATFDATNVIPTASLLDEYIVQTYTPSDHGNSDTDKSKTQGSHFAIIAAEDDVVVDYWPTVATTDNAAGTKVTTRTLKKGEVWYVWTGNKDGVDGDLSGTRVVARDGKKIAVFQGCPHTNIPYQVKQRDHIFSQAMPTAYWGSRFVLTASKARKIDKIRILALYDHTQVLINDEHVHTINFAADKKQYWEFEIGENGEFAESGSCYIATSCPCAVHLFMVSQEYDHVANGDPAMIWVNPIEQRIDQITFATYNSSNGDTYHYTNIVTDKPQLMTLDGTSIASQFKKVDGNPNYSYAQISLGSEAKSHTLKSNGSSFIAHVYGFTDNESYGYSAGSATIGREISVNNVSFESGERAKTKDDAPTYCLGDTVHFELHDVTGSIYRIVLDFGDGTSKDTSKVTIGAGEDINEPFSVSIKHTYTAKGWYDASAIVYGQEFCTQPAFTDTIPIIFYVNRPDTIRHQTFECVAEDYQGEMGRIDTVKIDCDSVVITSVQYGHDNKYVYKDTVQDGGYLNGQWFDHDTIYTWKSPKKNQQRCDSFVTCHLRVLSCLSMSVPNHKDEQYICPGDQFNLSYDYYKGDIGETHFILGDQDFIIVPNKQDRSFPLPTTEMKPGIYKGSITVQDTICDQKLTFPIDFTIFYPSTIFKYKFNNVLAVYNKEHNGGYDFVAYQWYRNGVAIPGATESVYHTAEPFTLGDVYFVVLTHADGLVLASCPYMIDDIPEYHQNQEQAPAASKHLVNRQIIIRMGEKNYNIYGQRVQ